MSTNEQWKKIKGYSKYEVSNTGKVRNIYNKKLKAIRKTKTGYCITDLKENNKKTTKYIHRLVGEAFITNPNNYPCINHKDENKENNHVENLEWCTIAYNNLYGTKNERMKKTQEKRIGKRVAKIDLKTNEIIEVFDSLTKAAESIGVRKQALTWALSSKKHTSGGFRWEVVE